MKHAAIAVLMLSMLLISAGSSGCLRSLAGTALQSISPPQPTKAPIAAPSPIETVCESVYQPAVYDPEPLELWMFRTGGRWMGENFTWRRDDVSGKKDLNVRVMVYGYRQLYQYQWWSVAWGKYFLQLPDPGKKFLFVYVYMEEIGEDQNWDPRMWGMEADHFYLQIDKEILKPDPLTQPCIRIREFDDYYDFWHVANLEYYGYYRAFERSGALNRETCQNLSYLHMGRSNSWSGYIPYQIPISTNPEDLIILGRFDGFGSAWWYLREKA